MMEENTPNKLWITTHINGFAHCCQLKNFITFFLFSLIGESARFRDCVRRLHISRPEGEFWEGGSELRVVRLFPTLPSLETKKVKTKNCSKRTLQTKTQHTARVCFTVLCLTTNKPRKVKQCCSNYRSLTSSY